MAQKKRRRKKLDTSKLVCFLLVGSGLLITQECIYLMRLCIKSNYMASAAWLTAALSLAQVIIITGGKCYFELVKSISTHAPAGGATAIFHKSVMRFCGKLPKDDTVLCLASFGFPRRDPKAVYLAWISCANLPQKCVRQGLALKDQGTSCFHEGLASHAFDPVLV